MFILVLILLFNILTFSSWVRNEKLRKLSHYSLFFFRRKHVWHSFFILFMFIFFFIFLFRIVRIFLSQKKYFDTYVFYNFVINLSFYEKLCYFLVFVSVLKLFISLKLLSFSFVRIHFFKLHYFIFLRFNFYLKFFKFSQFYKLHFFNFCGRKKYLYLILDYFLKYFFKHFVFVYFIYSFFFHHGIVPIYILQWYALYYFFFNIFEYVSSIICLDFEKGMVQYYYTQFYSITRLGDFKQKVYSANLILGGSYYTFTPSCFYVLDIELEEGYSKYMFFFSHYSTELDSFTLLENREPYKPILLEDYGA